jgi:hypothetical protein
VAPMFFMTFTLPLVVKKPQLLPADLAMIAGVLATAIMAQLICTYWRLHSFWSAVFHCLLLVVQAATFIVISPVSASLPPNSDVVISICGAGVFFLMLIINSVKMAVTVPPPPAVATVVHTTRSSAVGITPNTSPHSSSSFSSSSSSPSASSSSPLAPTKPVLMSSTTVSPSTVASAVGLPASTGQHREDSDND